MRVRKAVFPAAGLGTRFLPATKAQPKEMLPLVDKPTIQYVVEEAVASGLEEIILVTGRNKRAIEDHFDAAFELEYYLHDRGKMEELAQIKTISELASVSYVRQKEPLGLGHAILCARPLVGDEPFGVFLGDDIIVSRVPCMRQLLDVFERHGGPVLAVMRMPRDEHRPLRRHRAERARRQRLRGTRSGREARPARRSVRPGHHRPLRPHARHLPDPGRDGGGLARRDPAHQRAPSPARTPCHLSRWSSTASATTPGKSSGSSRRRWSSRWRVRTWPTRSALPEEPGPSRLKRQPRCVDLIWPFCHTFATFEPMRRSADHQAPRLPRGQRGRHQGGPGLRRVLRAHRARSSTRAGSDSGSRPRSRQELPQDDWRWAVLAGIEEVAGLLEGLPVDVWTMDEGTCSRPTSRCWSSRAPTSSGPSTRRPSWVCSARPRGSRPRRARCKRAAGQRQVISFGARRMHPALAPMIERNAFLGGCDGVAVTKSADLIDADPTGTIPHSLVLLLGTRCRPFRLFTRSWIPSVRRVALIDTLQDEKFEAIRVAQALGKDLYAVRLDTPSSRRGDFFRSCPRCGGSWTSAGSST